MGTANLSINPWKSDNNPWQKSAAPAYPSLSIQPQKLLVLPKSRAASISSSSSPPLPESDDWAEIGRKSPVSVPVAPSLAGMSKEDKAAELARRKEERKQRIALLKEQKKAAAVGKS